MSTAGYLFYIVNNETVSSRIGASSDKQLDYTISGRTFCLADLGDTVSLQMLKDTYFSMITSKQSNVEFEIVVARGEGNHKNNILDFYNNGIFHSNIYPILKFRGNIGENIRDRQLILNSECSFEEVKACLKDNLPDELILEIYKHVNNVKIELSVHDYQGNLYISNPVVDIKKSFLKDLIKLKLETELKFLKNNLKILKNRK